MGPLRHPGITPTGGVVVRSNLVQPFAYSWTTRSTFRSAVREPAVRVKCQFYMSDVIGVQACLRQASTMWPNILLRRLTITDRLIHGSFARDLYVLVYKLA